MPKVIHVPFCETLSNGVKYKHFNPRLFGPGFLLGRDREQKSKIYYARTPHFYIEYDKGFDNHTYIKNSLFIIMKLQYHMAKFLVF